MKKDNLKGLHIVDVEFRRPDKSSWPAFFIDDENLGYLPVIHGSTVRLPVHGMVYKGIFRGDLGFIGVCDGKRYDITADGFVFTGKSNDLSTFNCRKYQRRTVKTPEGTLTRPVALEEPERDKLTKEYYKKFEKMLLELSVLTQKKPTDHTPKTLADALEQGKMSVKEVTEQAINNNIKPRLIIDRLYKKLFSEADARYKEKMADLGITDRDLIIVEMMVLNKDRRKKTYSDLDTLKQELDRRATDIVLNKTTVS